MLTMVIPNLLQMGGIQQWALTVFHALTIEKVRIVNWDEQRGLIAKGVLKYFPNSYPHYFENFYKRSIIKRFSYKIKEPIHFWSIEPATAFTDKKYIITCHGKELLRPNHIGQERLYQKVLENARIIHVNSEFTRDLVSKNFSVNEEKIWVIPPSIKSLHRKKKCDGFTIGTISRLETRKNIIRIIQAMNILKERGQIFRYVLAGDGGERENILQEAKGRDWEFEYQGIISEKAKINRFYPSLDLFIMCPMETEDDVEGFGIVYIEANSFGIPVIASDTGGISDAVSENVSGMFANPHDAEDIADKVELAMSSNSCFEPRKWAKRFLLKKQLNKWKKMYGDAFGVI